MRITLNIAWYSVSVKCMLAHCSPLFLSKFVAIDVVEYWIWVYKAMKFKTNHHNSRELYKHNKYQYFKWNYIICQWNSFFIELWRKCSSSNEIMHFIQHYWISEFNLGSKKFLIDWIFISGGQNVDRNYLSLYFGQCGKHFTENFIQNFGRLLNWQCHPWWKINSHFDNNNLAIE